MQIGYHKYNITPKESVYMAGYSRQQKSTGVLDPIEINTLVFYIDQQFFILSILDSIIIEDSVIIPVKQTISNDYHIPEQQIIIGCIHTHSAPAFFKPFFENTHIEKNLQAGLIDQFIESIHIAMSSLSEATFRIQKVSIDGLYGNRNEMNGYADKDIIAFHFTYKNQASPFVSLLSMACHPTILNGKNFKLSADLFGAIRQKFLQKYGNECMLINGCCGDVSTRFYRELTGEKELERVSTCLLKQLKNLSDITLSMDTIKSTDYTCSFVFDGRNHEFTQTMIPKLKQDIQDGQQVEQSKILLNSLETKVIRSPMRLILKSNIVMIGQVIFISLPGDITSQLGKRIKDAFQDYLVIILGYCENYSNYFVCEEEYGKYFETYISRLDKGNADLFIQNVINKTKELSSL